MLSTPKVLVWSWASRTSGLQRHSVSRGSSCCCGSQRSLALRISSIRHQHIRTPIHRDGLLHLRLQLAHWGGDIELRRRCAQLREGFERGDIARGRDCFVAASEDGPDELDAEASAASLVLARLVVWGA